MIEIKRKVRKEIEETIFMDVKPFWVIRVVKTGNFGNKEVIHEAEYPYEPGEQEIADALVVYNQKDVFVSVVKNYRLEEVDNCEEQK